MNTDILNKIINTYDMNSINVMQFIKITMEMVEQLENKAGSEKKLIVISILNDFINIYKNSLALEIKILLDNQSIYYIIEAFVFTSKQKININNILTNKKCCFIC